MNGSGSKHNLALSPLEVMAAFRLDAIQALAFGQDADDGGDATDKFVVPFQDVAEGATTTREVHKSGQAAGVEPFLPTVMGGSKPAGGVQGEILATALMTEVRFEPEMMVARQSILRAKASLWGGVVRRHLTQ